MRQHVVLVGDSIFDNGFYVDGEAALIDQLREQLPEGCQATLLAVDGSRTLDIQTQIMRIPSDASHVYVSVGGNDALQILDKLSSPVINVIQALSILSSIRDKFCNSYRVTLEMLLQVGVPIVVCTIYDSIPQISPEMKTALAIFNDVIVREGLRNGCGIIDLRNICIGDSDYSQTSPIEPSSKGGKKIAMAIVNDLRRK